MSITIEINKYMSLVPNVAPESLKELSPKLRIFNDNQLQVWFTPLGSVNINARIAIYGITPGWTQMKAAYKAEINRRNGMKKDISKIAFAGSMRNNLIEMLNQLKVPEALNLVSSGELFQSSTLHSSSILKYPVFYKGKNYAGSTPSPTKHPFLAEILDSILASELEQLSNCLIIPLGKAANEGINHVGESINKTCCVLKGFPHPSGANGHRVKQFCQRKPQLTRLIEHWVKNNV